MTVDMLIFIPHLSLASSWYTVEILVMAAVCCFSKDPSLEEKLQYTLRENLKEIGQRCILDLREYMDRLRDHDSPAAAALKPLSKVWATCSTQQHAGVSPQHLHELNSNRGSLFRDDVRKGPVIVNGVRHDMRPSWRQWLLLDCVS